MATEEDLEKTSLWPHPIALHWELPATEHKAIVQFLQKDATRWEMGGMRLHEGLKILAGDLWNVVNQDKSELD
jgi:hypothetical protein